MKISKTSALLVLAVLAVATPASAATTAGRSYEGTVVSVDRSARTFKLRDAERGTVRVKVTSRTRYERLSGFSALRAGLTRIEVTVRRSNGRWVAVSVQRSGGGGDHGGGTDDHGGGTDDHGGHGGGNDDGPNHA